MLSKLLPLVLIAVPMQDSQYPKVDRVFVATPYNASIVFEYANMTIPEGRLLKDELVDCFVSKLKATGLFRDVQINVKTTDDGQKEHVEVVPEWDQGIDSFVISELVFEGFTDTDVAMLRRHLRRQGLKTGIHLFQYPLSRFKTMVHDAAQELYQGDPAREERIDELLSDTYFDLKVIAPRRVKLKIVAGKTMPCT